MQKPPSPIRVQGHSDVLRHHTVELRGFEPLTFCMPCSRVSSDSFVLGPITALQSGSSVRGRLAGSGGIWGHTGRPPARCLWVRSFSGGPRSEPDGRLSAHPALQRFHVRFAADFRLPRARRIAVAVSALCITHTSRHPVLLHRLAPFALRAAFPPSLAGRYSRDYYGASVTRGLASPQVIPRSSLSYVLARPRPPAHLLECPRWASPRHWRCARTQRHADAVPGTGFVRLSGGGKVYPGWRLGFRQSSFSHIARVPSARRPYASARPLVSWHALVPFTFRSR